jgi:hypothetical protein
MRQFDGVGFGLEELTRDAIARRYRGKLEEWSPAEWCTTRSR